MKKVSKITSLRVQRILKGVRKISIALGLIAIVLLATGFVFQSIATVRDKQQFPPPGQMVSAGQHALHINCQGTGSPTFVVDNGAGNWSTMWENIRREMPDDVQICLYDRAGLGWSDAGPMPRTSDRMVTELHLLLKNAEIEPPYILVGHSLGGYNVRIFQHRYPELVAGIALVESGHEEQWQRLPSEINDFIVEQTAPFQIAPIAARFGLLRFVNLPTHKALSAADRNTIVASMVQPKTVIAILSEFESASVSAEQLAETSALDDLPLVVVSAVHSFDASRVLETKLDVPFDEADRVWFELQVELATLSSNSRHFVSHTGSHDINFDDPEIVVEALLHLLAQVRD